VLQVRERSFVKLIHVDGHINIVPVNSDSLENYTKFKNKNELEHTVIFFLERYGSLMLDPLHSYIRSQLEQVVLLLKGYKNSKTDDFFSSFGCSFSYIDTLLPKITIFNTNKDEISKYKQIQTLFQYAHSMSCKLKLNHQVSDYIREHLRNIIDKQENEDYVFITFKSVYDPRQELHISDIYDTLVGYFFQFLITISFTLWLKDMPEIPFENNQIRDIETDCNVNDYDTENQCRTCPITLECLPSDKNMIVKDTKNKYCMNRNVMKQHIDLKPIRQTDPLNRELIDAKYKENWRFIPYDIFG